MYMYMVDSIHTRSVKHHLNAEEACYKLTLITKSVTRSRQKLFWYILSTYMFHSDFCSYRIPIVPGGTSRRGNERRYRHCYGNGRLVEPRFLVLIYRIDFAQDQQVFSSVPKCPAAASSIVVL